MAIITCHECGAVRTVVDGKKKKCRKCGTGLSSIQQPLDRLEAKKADELAEQITVVQLAEMYPNQVAEIVTEAKADATASEFGDLQPAEVAASFPKAVDALVSEATHELKTEIRQLKQNQKALVADAKTAGKNSILKMSISKIQKLKEEQQALAKKK